MRFSNCLRPMAMLLLSFVLLTSCESRKSLNSVEAVSEEGHIWNGDILSPSDSLGRSIVGLFTDGIICSGVIISKTKILTARHCVGNLMGPVTHQGFEVRFGDDFSHPERTLYAVSIAAPMGFDLSSLAINDLAILSLSEAVPQGYSPVALSAGTKDLQIGEPISIFGFGTTKPGSFDGKKRTAQLPFQGFFNNQRDIALRAVDRAACEGDSGGGAFRTKKNTSPEFRTLVGVFSFLNQYGGKRGDCTQSIISSYTNIEPFLSWIKSEAPDVIIASPENSTIPQPLRKSVSAALEFFSKAQSFSSSDELEKFWKTYESSSGLAGDYDLIFSRATSSDNWVNEKSKVTTLTKRMKLFEDRFHEIFDFDFKSLESIFVRLNAETLPGIKALTVDQVVLKFCMGYLPLNSQGPGLIKDPSKIDICADSVAVANYDLVHAAIERAIWNSLVFHEENPNYDLIYAWIWSHGISAHLIKDRFPEVPVFSDPSALVMTSSSVAFSQVARNFRAAPDSWKFVTSLDLNLMLATVDSLGFKVIELQIQKQRSLKDMLSMPSQEYHQLIDQSLDELLQSGSSVVN